MADKPLDNLQIRISVLSGEANNSIKKLAERIEALGSVKTDGLNNVVTALEKLVANNDAIRELADSLQRISDAMSKMGRGTKVVATAAAAAAGSTNDLSGATDKAAQSVEDVTDAADGAAEAISNVDTATLTTADDVMNGANQMTHAFGSLADEIREFGLVGKTIFGTLLSPLAAFKAQIGGLAAAIKRVAFYRLIRSAIKGVTQALREGTKMLIEWDRAYGNNTSYAAKTADEIAAKWREVKKSIGAAAMPIIQVFQPALMSLMQLVINVANTINQIFRKFQGFNDYMKATDKGFKNATASAKALKNVLFGFDELNVLPSESGGGASANVSAIDFKPAEITSEIAAAGANALKGIKKFIDDIKISFSGLWDVIAGKFKFILGLISGDWKTVWEGLKQYLYGWGEIVAGLFKTLLNAIGRLFEPVWRWLYDHVFHPIAEGLDWLKNFFGVAWEVVKAKFIYVWEGISSWFSDKFIPYMKGLPKFLWEDFKSDMKAVGEFFVNIWNSLSAWFGEKFIPYMKGLPKALWEDFKSDAKAAWEAIKNIFSNIPDWFKDKFAAAWTAVKNVFSTGGKIFDGIKEGIVNAFKTVVNAIIRGLNRVIAIPFNAINTVLAKIRDVRIFSFEPFKNLIHTISIPQIPQLAEGGFVPNGVGSLFIAGENGAELVTNAPGGTEVMNGNQVQEAMTNANLEVINALYAVANMLGAKIDSKNFDVYLDAQKVGKTVSQYQLNYARAMGV